MPDDDDDEFEDAFDAIFAEEETSEPALPAEEPQAAPPQEERAQPEEEHYGRAPAAKKPLAQPDDLPISVRRALDEAQASRQHQEAQSRRQELLDDLPFQFKRTRPAQETRLEAYFTTPDQISSRLGLHFEKSS